MKFGLYGLMAVGVLFATIGIRPAMAYDCNALVVDEAGVFGSDIGRVERAAQELERNGAYVRVRTVENFGGFVDLDRYEADHEAHCPAWQDVHGGTKSNLLVFVVSFGDQRGAGLYYGDLWKKALDQQWNTVLTDEVVPRLRDGDSPSAFVAGLEGVGDIVTSTKASRTASTSGSPVVVVQQPSQPTDLSGLWSVLKWLLLVGVIAGIAWAVNEWWRKMTATRAAQQRARLAAQACVNYVVTAEQPLAVAEALVNGQRGSFAESDLQPLSAVVAAAKRELAAAQTEYGELQASDANPDKAGLTEGEYDMLAERYDVLLAKFRAAASDVSGVTARIDELKALSASAEGDLVAAGSIIEEAGGRIQAVEAKQFRVPAANETLERALTKLGEAEASKAAKAFGKMRDELAEVNRLARAAADQAEAVERDKADIDADVAATRQGSRQADATLEQARVIFDEISQDFSQRCWEHVSGNGSAAEGLLDAADLAVNEAETAAGMEVQDWGIAHARLWSAHEDVGRAVALANAIIALKRDLDAAKAAAPAEIEAAAADIRAAREYIARYDEDIDDGLETRLGAIDRDLDAARRELASVQPDYIAVVKAARAANSAADGVLSKAQDEHQAMERLRQRAVTAMREAERSVSAAQGYIASHRSEVDSDAERLLGSAESALRSAQGATTLQGRIRYADQADQESDRALDMARSDVRRREEEREREERRRRDAAEAARRAASPSFSSPSYGSSHSTHHGGGRSGGSVGWGGSGGGRSGGSVSTGGRGGRSGGSVGW